MKKCLLIMLVSCGLICAEAPERIQTLSSKVICENTNGYFVLSDGSCWKAIGFSKRWRSLREWWNSVQLVPENYECVPNDWFLGTLIEVYRKHGNLEVDEGNAVNQETLKQCTHLLFNTRTGQVLFAISLHPAECIVQLFSEAHQDGYNKGFYEGRSKSYQNASDSFKNGYSEGYKDGYTKGLRDSLMGEEGAAQ